MENNHKTRKPLVIYDNNCIDGFGAAWCFWSLFKEDMVYLPGIRGIIPSVSDFSDIYVVDFNYPKDIIEDWLSMGHNVTVIDHHVSSYKELISISHPLFSYRYAENRSGAVLAWYYTIYMKLRPSTEIPPLLLHIQDRDLWKFELDGTKEIIAALFSYEYDFDLYNKLILQDMYSLASMRETGEHILRKHFKDVEEILPQVVRNMTINGFTVPVANVPYTLASDTSMKLSEGLLTFAAAYYDTSTHRVFSLRSHGCGLDVSKIAAIYGGGGHRHAAGFKVPREHELAKC